MNDVNEMRVAELIEKVTKQEAALKLLRRYMEEENEGNLYIGRGRLNDVLEVAGLEPVPLQAEEKP
ncbi:hypothetical protein [Butyrivibrio virus Ceridwen]|jgi:hypothetical protein|nr:hypothetical protein [Butyrivibrio virus Ceridwen]